MGYLGNAPADQAVQIGDGAVDTAQLAADAVTSAKIEDNAVDTEHLADDAIEAAELASDAVVNLSVASDAAIATSKLSGALTSVTSSGLGTAAARAAEDTMTDGSNLPDGAAIKAYGDTNWAGGGASDIDGLSDAVTTATSNIGLGSTAIDSITTGDHNIGLGDAAGTAITEGVYNTAIGSNAGVAISTGISNTLVGAYAGDALTSMTNNTAVGTGALGASSLVDSTVVIGSGAGAAAMTADADGTVAIGYEAGKAITSGGGNLLIGSGAGKNMTDAYQNVCIGQDAGDALVSCDGSNSRSTNVLIGYKCTDNSTSGEVKKNVIIGANTSTNRTENVFIGSGVSDDTCSRSILIGHAINGGGGHNVYNISREGSPQGSNTIMLGNSDVDSSNGLYCYDTGISSPSDRRIKENIVDLDYGLDFINLLRPRKFNKIKPTEYPEEILEEKYKQEDLEKRQYAIDTSTWVSKGTEEGLIAQEVKEAMESLGDIDFQGWQLGMNNTDQQTLSYVRFVIPLIKAVQELSAKVEALENA